uniref:Uncharacterized protein isoform X2 n=2 Tax=Nicotiana TaxID=4085 RepID=A0A1S4AFW7_TOBAC|nr:PREDICTED: uncharacterized protein LOC107797016 isoform X2 [Nicotiana tabacum]
MLLQSKVEQILYDALEVSFSFDQDIDEFWEYLKNELSTEEAKNAKITDEIEGLSREYVEDYSKLVNGIEGLSCSLELIESQACLAVMDFILLHVCRMSVSSMYSEHISAKFS